MNRRAFLRLGGLGLVVSAVDPAVARAAGAAAERLATTGGSGQILVYVFMRFGADGLNIVVPIEDGEYATYKGYRPTLAVDRDHPQLGRLDADFAFHPLMHDGLYQMWREGQVAVLPNTGYPMSTRSHFDSQMYLDNGTPHVKTTDGGWLNRWLGGTPGPDSPLRAIAFGGSMPRPFHGRARAINVNDLDDLQIGDDAGRSDRLVEAQRALYGRGSAGVYGEELQAAGLGLVAAMQSLRTSLPAPAVAYPKGEFGRRMSQLAQLIKADEFDVELAEVDHSGWDTHTVQQTSPMTGHFPSMLSQLSDGIAAFARDLGPERMRRVVVLAGSEFGRTSRENGNHGTDHGGAWATLVVGGKVRGGLYFGDEGWHGLENLRHDRDLEYSIDFRDAYGEVLKRHMGSLPDDVFPGWTHSPVGFL